MNHTIPLASPAQIQMPIPLLYVSALGSSWIQDSMKKQAGRTTTPFPMLHPLSIHLGLGIL